MKLITEVVEDLKCITESREDGKKNVYIEGIFLQGGIKNRNGRMYPVETLEKEVNRYDESYIQKGRALGELGHPDGPSINLDRVSHMITSLKREGTNFVGRAKLMDTPMGNIAKGLIGEGVKLGVSSRGMGSTKQMEGNKVEVQEDFELIGRSLKDVIAEPYRAALIPAFYQVKEAVLAAGALGMGISGSGPTLFVLIKGRDQVQQILEAARLVYDSFGLGVDDYHSSINTEGAYVLD